ncbi:MAG: DNA mismatch repair protein MutS [Candidatus Marinimicrobia bacterium]|nr:DNA mismatch repair protein MutS [Candidatus Neomarinimicrobiota bacterium]MCF7829603.1 DNA mismatch repair protein MutS [Candidatus Neomarinimicrobiota bacterium]MCF7879763.1 DNA mismatch repair protein MutS [Candidatus Neomarinimicrobiota bacterium]
MAKPKSDTTPLMRQYQGIKKKHRDAILLFRMGDFYETFNEDAKIAAKVLGITLTTRSNGKAAEVPLAGFPHHAMEAYLHKLLKAGHKVAICEQVEDPKQATGVVKRDVVEVVTPGTAVTDKFLDHKRNNFLMSALQEGETVGVAIVDVSTGEFQVTEVPEEEFEDLVSAYQPSELIIPNQQLDDFHGLLPSWNGIFTDLDDWIFSRDYAQEQIEEYFQVSTVKGFGIEGLPMAVRAGGVILHYILENYQQNLAHITGISRRTSEKFVGLDSATIRNLELFESIRGGGVEGTLLSIIDATVTAAGGRRLRQWIAQPLNDLEDILHRQSIIKPIFDSENLRENLADHLEKVSDLERILSRLSTGRANPKEVVSLKRTLQQVAPLTGILTETAIESLEDFVDGFPDMDDLIEYIDNAVVDDPPQKLQDGGIIEEGYHEELDELREVKLHGKEWIAETQQKEREKLDIPSLKIGYNKVFGYYIEVTKTHTDKIPDDYIRKQTLVNSERYITEELKEYEERILGAEEKIESLEYELFQEIREHIITYAKAIQKTADLLAQLDCYVGLAEVARRRNYVQPMVEVSDRIEIKDGRHPVVEELLPPGDEFIANDYAADTTERQIQLVTGPNMAGKSTYLRQIGLIVLLAQMGAWVPAKSATVGIVDKIFTRVGASDNLAGGESTFLVEMNETANILNNATPQSLIILDEIGRGTSTYDGLSIAWAVTEFLHNNESVAAKTLFATHYHELTELEEVLERVINLNVAVKDYGDKVVFLRKIVPGGCDHSYGIHVAKLAGIPDIVINRANEILRHLEEHEAANVDTEKQFTPPAPTSQMSLFGEQEQKLREELSKIDVNKMTPLDALAKLDELKNEVGL